MNDVEKRVEQLVLDKLADRPDLFIVDITMPSSGKLVILLDGDQGISIGDCAAVSRHVGFHLEEENLIDTAYQLEVSSPGLDSPLISGRQYQKNLGRNVQIKLADGTIATGKLTVTGPETIDIEETIKEKGKKAVTVARTIPLSQITETKVLISFK